MGPIICATRGGEASRRTQERAIELAKQQSAELIFLYVVDTSFAPGVDEAMAVTLTDELRRLGKCLLRLARKRARDHDIKARLIIREGDVEQSIEALVEEMDASTLVIGSPQAGPEPQAFEPEKISAFAARIRDATGIEVIVVE